MKVPTLLVYIGLVVGIVGVVLAVVLPLLTRNPWSWDIGAALAIGGAIVFLLARIAQRER